MKKEFLINFMIPLVSVIITLLFGYLFAIFPLLKDLRKIETEVQHLKETINKIKILENYPDNLNTIGEANVYIYGKFASGLDFAISSANGVNNWVKFDKEKNEILIDYPGSQDWGAAYFTVGEPSIKPRQGKDYSIYRKLTIEMKGSRGGETVLIGLKDKEDQDDGSEIKIKKNLTTDWKVYEFELKDFIYANLRTLYIPTEFVFEGNEAQTVYVRKIQFVK